MDPAKEEPTSIFHVVAMPYPGRGHINPMMNLCKQLASKKPDVLITFVVTEEWLGFIGSDRKPANIRFGTVPNVIPSELGRAKDFPGFLEAVFTKMEAPFEQLLDRLEPPVNAILADASLQWAFGVGNQTNIPVVSFWIMSATVLSVFHHFELLVQNRHFPVELSERGDERVDYIPGIPSSSLADLPPIFYATGRQIVHRAIESITLASKAYLLLTTFYELEAPVIDTLKSNFPFPVYPIGPSIPYFELKDNSSIPTSHINGPNYLQWLDSQPRGSVMYVSLGSFLSVSSTQMDEIVAGVCNSGVRYLWVAREDTSRFKDGCGDMGIVVPWCDQLRVLCHYSIGGFWTHCGWNSTLEAVYAGVAMLTFPIALDQVTNSKNIVEDWKIGWRVKKKVGNENLVRREEIAELVKRFMDLDSGEGKEIRKRAKELQDKCREAIAKGGSSETNLDAFIKDISQVHIN